MALDWHALGEVNSSPVHYRKFKIYDLQNRIEIGDYQLCGAPYGGPIAALSAPSSQAQQTTQSKVTPTIEAAELKIYSSSGVVLGSEPVRVLSRVVCMGWSDLETFVCIHEDGTVGVYDLFGQAFPPFSLFENLPQLGPSSLRVVDGSVWGAGLVALTSDWRLVAVDDLSAVGMHGRHLSMASSSSDQGPRLTRVMPTNLSERTRVLSLAVLAPHFTSSGRLEVLLGTNENTIFVVDVSGCEDQLLQEKISAPVVKMAIAPNGRFMACFLGNGVLTVLSTSFTTKILDFDTNSTRPPVQMEWCGEDAVCLRWQGFILVVGPFGHWLQFPYAVELGPCHVIPEQDCVRIVTPTTCEVLQRVPSATENIRRVFSTDPAAMLYDAMERFEDGDVKADDNLRAIFDLSDNGTGAGGQMGHGTGGGGGGDKLKEAVASCVAAAAAEFNPSAQKRYLRAATYGMGAAQSLAAANTASNSNSNKGRAAAITADDGNGNGGGGSGGAPMTTDKESPSALCEVEDSAKLFVGTCRKLRVLNQVRATGVGLPLSSTQYDRLTPQVLVDRLAQRRQHHLALEICDYLNLPAANKHKVLTHWACLKLRSVACREMSDSQLESLLVGTLSSHLRGNSTKQEGGLEEEQAMSFTSIALAAYDGGRGRVRLATSLLEYEKNAADKVRLLLSMGQPEQALSKACECLEGDLVFLVLLTLDQALVSAQQSENPQGAKKRLSDFFALVSSKKEAHALLQLYYRYRGDERLMKLHEHNKAFLAAGTLAATQAYSLANATQQEAEQQASRLTSTGGGGGVLGMRIGGAQAAMQQARAKEQEAAQRAFEEKVVGLRKAAVLLSQNQKELSFHQKVTDEQVELLICQESLERKYSALMQTQVVFVDLSVSETVHNLLVLCKAHPTERPNLTAEVARVQKQFKVPDKRLWHVKVRALAMSHQWDELRKFANEKKSPIGYKPFAERCIEQFLPAEEVAYYIDRMASLEERHELYVRTKLWLKALDVAQKLKDPNRLKQIRALCKDGKVERAVDQILAGGNF